MATFPSYKYPLEENEKYNQDEDKKCLAQVEERIQQWCKKGMPVAGVSFFSYSHTVFVVLMRILVFNDIFQNIHNFDNS